MHSTVASALEVPVATEKKETFGFAYWCLVFFTFMLFVAPQMIFGFLAPLHLAKVSMILALVVYSYQKLSKHENFFPRSPEVHLLALFIFLCALSIPFSLWPGGSLGLLFGNYLKSLAFFLLIAQLLSSLAAFNRMIWYMLICCFIVALTAIAGYQEGNLVEGYRMQGAGGGLTLNPNDFALTINLMLPFAFALYSLGDKLIKKGFCIAFIVIAVAAIMLTYSRAGFITLVIVLALSFWKLVKQGQRMKYVLPFVLVVAVFALLAPQNYTERLSAITDFSKDRAGSGQAREDAMTAALEVIAENPLLGVGMGMNVLALNDKGLYWAHVHNVYLQIASEIGVIGMVVFILLLVKLLKSLRQIQGKFKGDSDQRGLIVFAAATETSLLAFMIAALFHPIAYHFYFYYIAGLALALKSIASQTHTHPLNN